MSDLKGTDGLPITQVGAWTQEKHERLEKYVDITRGVRAKFARTETTYIELFCGPGRSIIEGTSAKIDGSPLIAATKAKESGVPYTDIHLADENADYVDAVCKRMPASVGLVRPRVGEADKTVDQIVARTQFLWSSLRIPRSLWARSAIVLHSAEVRRI